MLPQTKGYDDAVSLCKSEQEKLGFNVDHHNTQPEQICIYEEDKT